ncbi:hypothetical protein BDV93DRAFT_515682 [Ceratobasidium sp. AG-I]|nr:hypothetical protein BDV93DRAFT_515682 [Ceratobasidium sp. AG-I]
MYILIELYDVWYETTKSLIRVQVTLWVSVSHQEHWVLSSYRSSSHPPYVTVQAKAIKSLSWDFRSKMHQIKQKTHHCIFDWSVQRPSGTDNKSSHHKVVHNQEDTNPRLSDWMRVRDRLRRQTCQMAQAMRVPPPARQLLRRNQEGYYRMVWICQQDYAFDWSVQRPSDADDELSYRKVVQDEAGTEPKPSGQMHTM